MKHEMPSFLRHGSTPACMRTPAAKNLKDYGRNALKDWTPVLIWAFIDSFWINKAGTHV